MPESFIQVAPDSTGKPIRTEQVSVGTSTVHQQVGTLADASGNLVSTASVPGQLAVGSVPVSATLQAVSATAAGNTATSVSIPGVAGKTSYIRGFTVTTQPGTGGAAGTVTITGLSQNLSFQVGAPANSGVQLSVIFPFAIPAAAVASAVTVNVPALGANTGAVAVTAYGFQL